MPSPIHAANVAKELYQMRRFLAGVVGNDKEQVTSILGEQASSKLSNVEKQIDAALNEIAVMPEDASDMSQTMEREVNEVCATSLADNKSTMCLSKRDLELAFLYALRAMLEHDSIVEMQALLEKNSGFMAVIANNFDILKTLNSQWQSFESALNGSLPYVGTINRIIFQKEVRYGYREEVKPAKKNAAKKTKPAVKAAPCDRRAAWLKHTQTVRQAKKDLQEAKAAEQRRQRATGESSGVGRGNHRFCFTAGRTHSSRNLHDLISASHQPANGTASKGKRPTSLTYTTSFRHIPRGAAKSTAVGASSNSVVSDDSLTSDVTHQPG